MANGKPKAKSKTETETENNNGATSSTVELLQSLPTEVFATILSFETNHTDRISQLLSCLLANDADNEDDDNKNDNDDEEEAIFRALCLLHWNSISADARPQFFTSWRSLYRVLEQWVHRQGFYSLLEAAPWGLLLRLRFVEGSFVGDLMWPGEEQVSSTTESTATTTATRSFQSIRLLNICFDCNGSIDEIEFCNVKYAPDVICINHQDENDDDDDDNAMGDVAIGPVVIPHCPYNTFGKRGIRFRGIKVRKANPSFLLQHRKANPSFLSLNPYSSAYRRSWARLWHPFARTPPVELVQSLLSRCNQIHLDWVEGPVRWSSFQYNDEMPLIKPGLYSGAYKDTYGKFKREVILIEYVQYQFTIPGQNDNDDDDMDDNDAYNTQVWEDNQQVWEEIRSTIFNYPNQSGYEHRFQTIQETLVKAKCKTAVFVLGKKVTGDVHVPMKQTTFGALVSPLIDLDEGATDAMLERVTDRGGSGQKEYTVVRSWNGWGTLAYPMFEKPSWSNGTLVQVRDPDEMYYGNSTMPVKEQFGFVWGRDSSTTILSRMSEQDEFPWFA